jgi:Skp family chaperone for outer membrane proteins
MKRSTLITFAAAAAITAAFFTGSSVANSSRLAPPSPTIATVNIQTIFDQMTERKDKLDQLQAEAVRLEGEFAAIGRLINNERDTANKMTDGPNKDLAIEAVVDKDVQANLNIKKAKAKLEKAQADTIRAIFDKIQKEAGRHAAVNGYSMVMVADDWVTISPRATSQEATQVMSLRRFLYVDNKQHDITAAVLKSINDAYALTKPPAPAPAAPAPATGTPATPPR